MKVDAIITAVHPAKNVTNERGEFKFIPIEIEFPEDCHRFDGSIFVREHNIKVDIVGQLAQNFNLQPGTSVTIDLQFYVNEKDGRKFQSIRSSYITLR